MLKRGIVGLRRCLKQETELKRIQNASKGMLDVLTQKGKQFDFSYHAVHGDMNVLL